LYYLASLHIKSRAPHSEYGFFVVLSRFKNTRDMPRN
jgi:hypothetical protein